MKVRDVSRLLKNDDWYLVATEGSHRQFKHPKKRVRYSCGQAEQRFAHWNFEQYFAASRTERLRRFFINMRYAVVFEKAENNYAAYVPDLLGCVATGETIEETEREIREAIEFHLRGMREDGLPIPEPIIRVEYVEVAA